jgi:CYTH domain-containing protein
VGANFMALEIERKFLCRLISLPKNSSQQIKQFYIFISRKNEIRLRRIDNNLFFLTMKHGVGQIRKEYEWGIPKWLFFCLSKLTRAKVEKKRYLYKNWEIDVYSELPGFAVAEIELKEPFETMTSFPPFITPILEITNDERWKNHNIALKGLPRTHIENCQ